jgi:hypothetical protein
MAYADAIFRVCRSAEIRVIEVIALQEKPVTISSRPTYGRLPQSPTISPDVPALEFTVKPAVTQTGEPTVAIFAAGLLPGRYAEIYGGRIPGALEIVAIESTTGEVFHNEAQRGHAAPISAVMNPAPTPPGPDEATVESIEVHFAVDLRAHLQLPNRLSRYWVFLWLDEMTSKVHQAEVPGPAQSKVAPSAGSVIGCRPVVGAPTVPPKGIALRESGGRFDGQIGSELLVESLGRKCLSLFALDYRSRACTGRSFELPAEVPQGRNLSFHLLRSELFAGPGWLDSADTPRSVFVVAAMGGVLSRVLVLTA